MRRSVLGIGAALAVVTAAVFLMLATCDGTAPGPGRDGAAPDSPREEAGGPPGEPSPRSGPRPRVRAASPDEAAADPAPAPAPQVPVLRIVDESGAPVPGVLVWWGDSAPDVTSPSDGITGENGEVESRAATSAVYYDRTGPRIVALSGPVTESVARGLPPLEVEVVDGLSGATAQVEGVRATTFGGADGRGPEVHLRRAGDRWVLPAVPLVRGTVAKVWIRAAARAGVVSEPTLEIDDVVGPATRTLRATLAVYPEADVRVAATGPGGTVPARLEVDDVEMHRSVGLWSEGRRDLTLRVETDGVPGTWRVRGLPAVPHLRTRLGVRAPPDTDDPHGDVPRATTRWLALDRPAACEVVLDPVGDLFEGPAARSAIGIGGSRGVVLAPLTPENSSRVAVRVLRDDGSPAAGARIEGADEKDSVTDSEGRAEVIFRRGRARITATLAGMLPTSDLAEIPPPGEVLLREPSGRAVDVVVVDAEGRPAPLASIRADVLSWVSNDGTVQRERWPFVRVERGIQWTTLRTDALGRLRLSRVPAGTIRVVATLGSAVGSADSDAPEIRVELAVPRVSDDE